ncbi:MAG: hypothetical protein CME04_21255 [Gemmatimonadaceae bacterium]|nr:hypothetical protein [Gemmatimonadaceae bacterium]
MADRHEPRRGAEDEGEPRHAGQWCIKHVAPGLFAGLGGALRRGPPGRTPPFRRVAQKRGTEEDADDADDAVEDEERLPAETEATAKTDAEADQQDLGYAHGAAVATRRGPNRSCSRPAGIITRANVARATEKAH